MEKKDVVLAKLIKDLKKISNICQEVKSTQTDLYTLSKVREISSISLLAIDDIEMLNL